MNKLKTDKNVKNLTWKYAKKNMIKRIRKTNRRNDLSICEVEIKI